MKSLKTISMNCFKIHTANREFSLYGGLRYRAIFPKICSIGRQKRSAELSICTIMG